MRCFLPLLIFISSCINHQPQESDNNFIPSPKSELEIVYAKGFEINYTANHTVLVSKSIAGNDYFRDSLILQHADNESCSAFKSFFEMPRSLNCQSSTHLAYIDFFDQLGTVKGLCGIEYVHPGKINDELVINGTQEVCLGENIQIESVLKTNPDLFMVYPFAISQVESLESNGIKTFMIAEYLETHPLARLEWLKLFAVIFEQEEKANAYFNEVEEEYNSLTQMEPDSNKKFIFNLPYGENWFTPSANSLIVRLLEDAGLYYFYQNEVGTENITHPQEQVWSDGTKADYWVIIADRPDDFSLAQLQEENSVYTSFKAVKNHQVIFCNSRTSDYFLTGVIEPHLMLKDILYATHKIDNYTPKYFRLLK